MLVCTAVRSLTDLRIFYYRLNTALYGSPLINTFTYSVIC